MKLLYLLAIFGLFHWTLAAPILNSQVPDNGAYENDFTQDEDRLLLAILQDYYTKMAWEVEDYEHSAHLDELMAQLLAYYKAEGIDPLFVNDQSSKINTMIDGDSYPNKRIVEDIDNNFDERYLESIGQGLLPSKRYLESIGQGLLPSKRYLESIGKGLLPSKRYLESIGQGLLPSKRYLESIGKGLLPSKRYLESIGQGLLPSKRYLESIGKGLLPSKRYLESIGQGLLPSKRYLESIGQGLLPSKRYLESIGKGLLPSKRYLESIGKGLLPSKRYLESIGKGLLPSKRYLESIGQGLLPSKRQYESSNEDEKFLERLASSPLFRHYLQRLATASSSEDLDVGSDAQSPTPAKAEVIKVQEQNSGPETEPREQHDKDELIELVNKLIEEAPKSIR